MDKQIKYILTDIEGTTSSVHFVYDVLFPYFKEHIQLLTQHAQINEVKQAFAEVIELAAQEDGVHLTTTEEHRARVLQLGEEPDRVFNFGAPVLDAINDLKLLSREEIEHKFGIRFGMKN
ncbi:MAG: UDP-N-acetylglucosamine 2-epimerase, partial [Sphingomonadales bacterium]